jgi:hypothetical protein
VEGNFDRAVALAECVDGLQIGLPMTLVVLAAARGLGR